MGAKGSSALESKTKAKLPKMYMVIFYNDDFTPMDFVTEVLQLVFNKGPAEAYSIMINIHKGDRAVVGIYTKDIAFTKAMEATKRARQAGYPLKVTAEPE